MNNSNTANLEFGPNVVYFVLETGEARRGEAARRGGEARRGGAGRGEARRGGATAARAAAPRRRRSARAAGIKDAF